MRFYIVGEFSSAEKHRAYQDFADNGYGIAEGKATFVEVAEGNAATAGIAQTLKAAIQEHNDHVYEMLEKAANIQGIPVLDHDPEIAVILIKPSKKHIVDQLQEMFQLQCKTGTTVAFKMGNGNYAPASDCQAAVKKMLIQQERDFYRLANKITNSFSYVFFCQLLEKAKPFLPEKSVDKILGHAIHHLEKQRVKA